MSTTQLPRGAKPTPRHKLACATPHRVTGNAPPEFALVPTRLSFWGNQRDGDCVSAEEAFAKIAASPNVFVTEPTLVNWAGRHGWLNGAMLPEVMDAMISEGIAAEDGKVYKDGPYSAVNWHDRATLCDAISRGPVKIAVAADQLQGAVRQPGRNGWFGVGFYEDPNTDHCVSLCGYGSMKFLADKLGVAVPPGVDPAGFGYLLFTWSSIGVIDERSMRAITSEAWLRSPTTAGYPTPAPVPTPVPPTPPAPPTPQPSGPNYVGAVRLTGHVPAFGGDATFTGTIKLSPADVARLTNNLARCRGGDMLCLPNEPAQFAWPSLDTVTHLVEAAITVIRQDGPLMVQTVTTLLKLAADIRGADIAAVMADLNAVAVDVPKLIADIRAAFGL